MDLVARQGRVLLAAFILTAVFVFHLQGRGSQGWV
jgi:hypothetical protein